MPLTPPVVCQAVMSTLSSKDGNILVPNLDRQDGKEAVTLLEIYETPHVVVEKPTSKMPMTAVDTASNVKLQLED